MTPFLHTAPKQFAKNGRSGGFSLMEVLFALTIFSVAIVGIIQGVAVQLRAEKLAEDTTRATILAQNLVEELRYTEEFSEEGENGEFDGDDAGFAWEYTMVESELEDLYEVTVIVSWSDGATKRNYTVDTFITAR